MTTYEAGYLAGSLAKALVKLAPPELAGRAAAIRRR
jgi:hypothetical protein